MNIRSKLSPLPASRRSALFTSLFNTSARSARPQASRFLRITATDAPSESTKTASKAPRLRASMPMAPVPAKRSSAFLQGKRPCMMSKTASLTLSDVGRVESPLTGASLRPLHTPAMTLIFPVRPVRPWRGRYMAFSFESPVIFIEISLERGPSNSEKYMACHCPSTRRPFVIGTVTLLPTSRLFKCASAFLP